MIARVILVDSSYLVLAFSAVNNLNGNVIDFTKLIVFS